MAKLSIVAGATSQSVNIFVQDSSSTTGAGLSGLVFNTSGLIAYYTFTGANAAATAITLATLSTVGSAYSSGGFKEIDATNMKGLYRLDLPNAALATSKGRVVTVQLGGAANMAPCVLEIELTGWDNQDSVHGGLTALPNTAVTTNASLLTSGTGTDQLSVTSGRIDAGKMSGTSLTARDIGASVLLSAGTGTGQLDFTSGVVKSNLVQILATALTETAGQIAAAFKQWFNVATPVGTVNSIPNATAGAAGGLFIAGTNAATTVTTALTTTFTGNLTGSVGSVTGAVGSVTGAVGSVTGNVGGNVVGSVANVTARVTANTDQIAGGTVNALVGGKIDAVNSVHTGTAQAGAGTSITLDSGASATDSLYNQQYVQILSGTGTGQTRMITAYVGSTKVATTTPAWATNPASDSIFVTFPQAYADVRDWGGVNVAVNVAGIPKVDVVDWLGTTVTAATAGIPDANAKNINNVSTSSVATINANQGTTQPTNFTGTGASALVKGDATDIGGHAVTLDGNNLLSVNIVDVNGSATVETGITVQQALQYIASAVTGVLAGAATTTVTIAAINNSGTNRITATVDANGNRSAVSLA